VFALPAKVIKPNHSREADLRLVLGCAHLVDLHYSFQLATTQVYVASPWLPASLPLSQWMPYAMAPKPIV
jgi:hypothetical protein